VAGLGRMPETAVVDVVGAVLDHVEVVLDYVAAPVELATVHSLVLDCISFSF
jgi:hypothetical protein